MHSLKHLELLVRPSRLFWLIFKPWKNSTFLACPQELRHPFHRSSWWLLFLSSGSTYTHIQREQLWTFEMFEELQIYKTNSTKTLPLASLLSGLCWVKSKITVSIISVYLKLLVRKMKALCSLKSPTNITREGRVFLILYLRVSPGATNNFLRPTCC
jgi:hypothetical protein